MCGMEALMKTNIFRYTLAGILMLGLAIPSAVLAGNADKGCSLQGSWFGVTSPEDTTLSGWMVTVTGKSENRGTNNLEYPTFDPTLGIFPQAVRISSMRGAWERTGGNTFDYTFMGMAVDEFSVPVWIGKVSGHVTLSADCSTETITATMEVFLPTMSPFDDDPLFPILLPTHYGRRLEVDLL
jgi:hypothetical protein